LSYKA
jgi:hypothetical protein